MERIVTAKKAQGWVVRARERAGYVTAWWVQAQNVLAASADLGSQPYASEVPVKPEQMVPAQSFTGSAGRQFFNAVNVSTA